MQLSLNLCIRTLSALADSTEARTGFTWQFVYTVDIMNFVIQIWVGLPFKWPRAGKHHYFCKRLFQRLFVSFISYSQCKLLITRTTICDVWWCLYLAFCYVSVNVLSCGLCRYLSHHTVYFTPYYYSFVFARGICIGYA